MATVQFTRIQDLISSIQKEKARLWEGSEINSVQVDEQILDRIENILRENRPLFEKWFSDPSLHFIKEVTPLCAIRKNLREFTEIAAFSLSNVNERGDVVRFFSEMRTG